MNTEIDTTNNKLIIRTTLRDYASEDKGTFDVVIEISADGIEIRPSSEEDLYSKAEFRREVWVEFYLSTFQTFIWDGTQEDPTIMHTLLEKGPPK